MMQEKTIIIESPKNMRKKFKRNIAWYMGAKFPVCLFCQNCHKEMIYKNGTKFYFKCDNTKCSFFGNETQIITKPHGTKIDELIFKLLQNRQKRTVSVDLRQIFNKLLETPKFEIDKIEESENKLLCPICKKPLYKISNIVFECRNLKCKAFGNEISKWRLIYRYEVNAKTQDIKRQKIIDEIFENNEQHEFLHWLNKEEFRYNKRPEYYKWAIPNTKKDSKYVFDKIRKSKP